MEAIKVIMPTNGFHVLLAKQISKKGTVLTITFDGADEVEAAMQLQAVFLESSE
ncbi:hypothetical protein ACFSTH_06080 [Paenibacillus yanchengensis]|uniref:Uncharacterized protein n=1 Tax=Paenibacillus yanchengensis TaxID=2035833 RepID=A0ABW4YHE2_9BACL